MKTSQNNQILAHLKSGKTITPLQALWQFNCFRLSGRIHELKSKGWNITSEMIELNGKRFAEYSL
jgi:hypothetical protein